MLYMLCEHEGTPVRILVLETANLERIKEGLPAVSPDKSVVVAWTPDPVWLADRIMDDPQNGPRIAQLIDESAKRPQKPTHRPKHEPYIQVFGEKPPPAPSELQAQVAQWLKGEEHRKVEIRTGAADPGHWYLTMTSHANWEQTSHHDSLAGLLASLSAETKPEGS